MEKRATHGTWRLGIVAAILATPLGAAPFALTAAARGTVTAETASALPWSKQSPCIAGALRCVDGVLSQMERRFRDLARRCDHDALFALLYLRTTEEYRRTVAADPEYFVDTAYVNREDAMFSDDYMLPYDAWHEGGTVPEAWAIAFEAAERREVSGMGNTLLGMNAHINRDLPFVLAELGLTHPDGSSRKPDHDKVDAILHRVVHSPVIEEAAQRFDPSMKNADVPGTTLDADAFLAVVVAWRERAWWNAVSLASAPTSFVRTLVAQQIEQTAAAQALAIKGAFAYLPPVSSTAPRDAYCAAQ